MKLYNTLTRQKEEFVPLNPNLVLMYGCGPTVYNYIHVGNARAFVLFDILRRYLLHCGYNVKFVQNFTDIDDKIINRARELGKTAAEIAETYIVEYRADAAKLNILPADEHPRATESIPDIIRLVSTLTENGNAYEANGDVYFRVKSFPEYGKLSGQSLDDLEDGARVDPGDAKESPADFALWKAAKPGEPSWDSPWGKGRPGWHIECSAMNLARLGETIDIHGGGSDLVFPHHENEIAQSEAATGKQFVRYWVHNGFITVDHHKMSKSEGNFFTVRDAAEEYGYETIRFFLLSAHYRSPLNYSRESLEQARAALARLYTARDNWAFLATSGDDSLSNEESKSLVDSYKYQDEFADAMDDDLNTADAIGVIFELVRKLNTELARTPSRHLAQVAMERLDTLCGILGLLYEQPVKNNDTDDFAAEVETLIAQRQVAREGKDFAEADRIRDELKSKGVILEDTPQGVKWKRS